MGRLGWRPLSLLHGNFSPTKRRNVCMWGGRERENESGLGIDFCHENLFPFLSFSARFSTRRWARSILLTFPKDFSRSQHSLYTVNFDFISLRSIHIIHSILARAHSDPRTNRFLFSFTGTVITVDFFWYRNVPLMNETERFRPSRRTTKSS